MRLVFEELKEGQGCCKVARKVGGGVNWGQWREQKPDPAWWRFRFYSKSDRKPQESFNNRIMSWFRILKDHSSDRGEEITELARVGGHQGIQVRDGGSLAQNGGSRDRCGCTLDYFTGKKINFVVAWSWLMIERGIRMTASLGAEHCTYVLEHFHYYHHGQQFQFD